MMDLDALRDSGWSSVGFVEHCGRPMTFRGTTTTWEGKFGSGWQVSAVMWACTCGVMLTATVRTPS